MSLENQLEGEMATKNQAKKEREELGTHLMQTSTELEALRTFNDFQDRVDMSSKTQVELKS
jgi:hypothetical protein